MSEEWRKTEKQTQHAAMSNTRLDFGWWPEIVDWLNTVFMYVIYEIDNPVTWQKAEQSIQVSLQFVFNSFGISTTVKIPVMYECDVPNRWNHCVT